MNAHFTFDSRCLLVTSLLQAKRTFARMNTHERQTFAVLATRVVGEPYVIDGIDTAIATLRLVGLADAGIVRQLDSLLARSFALIMHRRISIDDAAQAAG